MDFFLTIIKKYINVRKINFYSSKNVIIRIQSFS